MAPPPVKEAALRLGCEIAQPPKVRDPEFVARLEAIAPDFLVVVAFGQILPQNILQIPKGRAHQHTRLIAAEV